MMSRRSIAKKISPETKPTVTPRSDAFAGVAPMMPATKAMRVQKMDVIMVYNNESSEPLPLAISLNYSLGESHLAG